MRRLLLPAVLLWAAACAGPAPRPVAIEPAPPPPPPVVEMPDPNFELAVTEVVPNASDEGISYTAVFVDGALAAKTSVGARSQEHLARLRLPEGNRLVRLEQWYLPPVGEWERLPDARQPRERFVRVEPGEIARVDLRYGSDGRPSLRVSHRPVDDGTPPAPAPDEPPAPVEPPAPAGPSNGS